MRRAGVKRKSTLERLLEKVSPEPNTGCWLWTAACAENGYARVATGSVTDRSARFSYAHRVAYQQLVGPIPDHMELDHLCRVRCCVNPAHLEPVTRRENVRRGLCGDPATNPRSQRTHCPKGHPYSGDNVLYRPRGGRTCRACQADASRRWADANATSAAESKRRWYLRKKAKANV